MMLARIPDPQDPQEDPRGAGTALASRGIGQAFAPAAAWCSLATWAKIVQTPAGDPGAFAPLAWVARSGLAVVPGSGAVALRRALARPRLCDVGRAPVEKAGSDRLRPGSKVGRAGARPFY